MLTTDTPLGMPCPYHTCVQHRDATYKPKTMPDTSHSMSNKMKGTISYHYHVHASYQLCDLYLKKELNIMENPKMNIAKLVYLCV